MNRTLIIILDALLIATAVFVFGIFVNRFFDNYRLNSVIFEMNNDSVYRFSLSLEREAVILGFTHNNSLMCSNYTGLLDKYRSSMNNYGTYLENYGKIADSYKSIYQSIQNDYYIGQLYYYNTILMINRECNVSLKPVIFVYQPNSQQSILQGYALNELEKECKGVYIVTFDQNFSNRTGFGSSVGIIYNGTRIAPIVTTGTLYDRICK